MNKRLLIISLGLIATVVVAILGLSVKQALAPKPGNLEIKIVPADTKLTVDGKTKSVGTLSLSPGEHTLKFERNGFTSQTVNVTITSGQQQTKAVVLSGANSAIVSQYFQDHPDEVQAGEGLTGEIIEEHGQIITKNNPLITLLPYVGADFRVDIGVTEKHKDNPDAVGIYITASTDAAKTHALNWIKAQGYDPNTYEIIYQ